jgi:hypothetical protein
MAKNDADALRRKREKLEAELAVLRDQERTAAEKCHAIAGRAALDHAAKNPGFKRELMRALGASASCSACRVPAAPKPPKLERQRLPRRRGGKAPRDRKLGPKRQLFSVGKASPAPRSEQRQADSPGRPVAAVRYGSVSSSLTSRI